MPNFVHRILPDEQSDLIALQELILTNNNGDWLVDQRGMSYVKTVLLGRADQHVISYGIAILSRHSFILQEISIKLFRLTQIQPALHRFIVCVVQLY